MTEKLCSHSGCNNPGNPGNRRPVFRFMDKCIFHCEKDDWYTERPDGTRDWSKTRKDGCLNSFWNEFKAEYRDKKNFDFSCYIFPETVGPLIDIFSEDVKKQLTPVELQSKLVFGSSEFYGEVNFAVASFHQTPDFSYAQFHQPAMFRAAKIYKPALFVGTQFNKKVDFGQSHFFDKADFYEAKFHQQTLFHGARFDKEADFRLVKFHMDADFRGGQFFRAINYAGARFHNRADFLGATMHKQSFEFLDNVFNGEFKFGPHRSLKNKMLLKELSFTDCAFAKDSIVFIANLSLEKLIIRRLVNLSSSVKLTNIDVSQNLILVNSDFGGVEFNDVDFSGAKKRIETSSFSGALFNGVEWGDISKIEANRDTFRQLKAANEDQKNYIQANEFYGQEMNEYGKEIKGKPERIQDRITFWAGKHVSDFSNNWVKPIWWFIGLGLVFYLICWPIQHWGEFGVLSRWWHSEVGARGDIGLIFDLAWKFLNSFARFINPLYFGASEKYNSVFFIWMLHKILAGFVIYQFIVSLRRKTRH